MNAADILFFALLAGFILYKLYTVLGRDDFNDSEERNNKKNGKFTGSKNPEANENKVVAFPGVNATKRPTETSLDKRRKIHEPEIVDVNIAKQLEKIKDIEPSFSAGIFLEGAKSAFEMVISAFSDEDGATLQNLLSPDVYKAFGKEIDRLEKAKEDQTTTLISILESNIVDIDMKRKTAKITIEFVSEQIYVLKDKDDKIIAGDPSQIDEIKDRWIFERALGSNNPNWMIIST